ncbi:MAG: leucine-rich repeat domain-containing protein [Spirochaetales bacterium]|nr:leucine-rich repeat domain-containing protein [Spirochaetales bacterium]
MKRFLLGFILILSVLFTFMGCSEETVENDGTLDIHLATSGTKGVAPSVSLDAESYHIVVRNSSSVSVFDETVKNDSDLEIALEPGLYNVTVDALNGEGKVIGRGTADGTVEAGKSTVLSISIQEIEGKGTLSINISAENSRNIGYEVLSSTGSFITSGSLSYKDGKHTAEAELSNGFYVLRIKDSDTGKTLKIESFRIVSDCTTTYDSAVSSSSSSPSSPTTYRVGDIGPAGGYVFYDCDADNDTGNADGLKSSECGWRYLEAAPADLRIVNDKPTVDSSLSGYSSGTDKIYYGCYRTSADGDYLYVNGKFTYDSSNCTGNAIGTGNKNTELLVGTMGDEAYKNDCWDDNNSEKISDYAARLCDILEYTKDGVTYTDWFLPSKDELNLMYTNLHEKGLGDFNGDSSNWPYYWSSSEYSYNADIVWLQFFDNGIQIDNGRNKYNRVRPVRAFLTDEICEHTWNDGEITSEASCDHNGIRTYTCIECNMTKVEIIPMIDHVYGDWIVRTAATTSSDGEKYKICTICGHEETDVIPKLSSSNINVGDIDWTITVEGEITPTNKSEVIGEIVIPSEVDGITVTSIGWNAFSGCTKLTSITIPDSVTSIGEEAFSDCTSLMNVYASSLLSWCNIDFGYSESNPMCYASNLYLNGKLFSGSVEIPAGVSVISHNRFRNCSSITSITIPDSVTSIDFEAFAGCTSLESITIPNSVTNIGWGAFSDCTSLKIVNIPNSVTNIGWGAAFRGCTGLTSITLPNSITSIESYTFEGCSNLKNIIIPDSVTSIGNYAFEGCSSLLSINYLGTKDQWLSISKDSDWNNAASALEIHCSDRDIIVDSVNWTLVSDGEIYPNYDLSLEEYIVVPYEVKGSTVRILGKGELGNGAFEYWSELTGIVIPDTITTIRQHSFYECTSLKDVYVSDLSSWCNICFESEDANPMYYANNLHIGDSLLSGHVEVPSDLSVIPYYAFSSSNITSITIPNSIKTIETGAFANCTNLESVTFQEGSTLTSIGWQTFMGCKSLKSMVIPDSVTIIGWYSFSDCTSLETITIPNSVNNIESHAFSGCKNLKSITLPEYLYYIGDGTFYGCTSLESIIIPDQVSWIGWSAFFDCTNLTSIVIPDPVTTIGFESFYGCTNLSSIIIPKAVESIEDNAFTNCTSLSSITFLGTSSQWAKIQKGNNYNQNVPASVVHCTDVDMPIYLESYWMVDTSGEIKPVYKDLVSGNISIPQEVNEIKITSIGDNAFKDCIGLESITIPESVTSIGDFAFSNCSRLASISFLGTSEKWKSVLKGSEWNNSIKTIHCADADISIM